MVSTLDKKDGDANLKEAGTNPPAEIQPLEDSAANSPESKGPTKPPTSAIDQPEPDPTQSVSSAKPPAAPTKTRSIQQSVLKPASEMVHQMLTSKKEKSKEMMNRGEINQLITYRMQGARPEAWEEDISRNTLDAQPFNNVTSVSERGMKIFNNAQKRKVIQSLLGERPIEDLVARDTFPIPCADDREGYSPGNDGYYWMSGLEDYLKVMEVVKRLHVYPRSILDFGCASGRVIRHFAAQTEIPEVWGTDINARHIRWLFEFMPPQVKPIFNHCIPSLPIRDNSIDVITAFSVFTHIDTFETCWLAELRRIMHDDGICYLTVHNEDTWNICRDEIDNPNNRLVQSILKIDPEVINKIHEPLADTRTVYRFAQAGPYRAQVFHSNNYLHKVWGRFFTIEEILPCHHVRQSVLVMRKR